eukprot:2069209-Pyramimonas_sp.AAC.1
MGGDVPPHIKNKRRRGRIMLTACTPLLERSIRMSFRGGRRQRRKLVDLRCRALSTECIVVFAEAR